MINDVLIIGGGPAGLYAAFYCGLRGLQVKILEGSENLGGKINFYKDRKVWDVGGLPGISGESLIQNLVHQAQTFQPEILLNQLVKKISKQAELWKITVETGESYLARSLIMATGTGLWITTPKISLKSESVSILPEADLIEVTKFTNKKILIIGKKATVKKAVKKLAQVTDKITYSGKSIKEFSAYQQLSDRKDWQLEESDTGINLISTGGKISFDQVLVLQNKQYQQPLVNELAEHFSVNQNGQITTQGIGKTEGAGFYVIGDACQYENKNYLIASSIHDALETANQVACYLDPAAKIKELVSTHHPRLMTR